ncbi:hypothetical protein GCM10027515_03840 [Schumannella luteola]|uniref:Uncharacterized protein (DUF302 family) n=1 Tax=Schumannella luteola TaxID=472059 RepID=A0A852YBA8_9MICO|nr:DUF302 domain-containing protein [Schumannella luteola]NYG98481.1 uncharacterized protein (DUF302 family) [Schumannella luteola]TPX01293.1 DUF302 domain-containing protein [Schumannella luteola]
MTSTQVVVERHDLVSSRDFATVRDAVHAGLGHPDFPVLAARLAGIADPAEFRAVVAGAAGPAGLMIFLELDLGAVVARDPDAVAFRAVRIIAGNPVTMESMVRTTPQAAAGAPVTILVFERDDGVHLRYDTCTSLAGAELTPDAAAHAAELDRAVLELLDSAA